MLTRVSNFMMTSYKTTYSAYPFFCDMFAKVVVVVVAVVVVVLT